MSPARLKSTNDLLRNLIFGLMIMGVFAAIIYWKRDAVKRFGNEWNADRHRAKAAQELENDAPEVALRRALTSLRLKPNNLETLRILLQAATESSDNRLLVIAETVFLHPDSSESDKLQSLAAVNKIGDPRRFERLWETLPEKTRNLPEAEIGYLNHLLLLDRPKIVLERIEESYDAGSPKLRLAKVEALFKLRDDDSEREAIELGLALLEDAEKSDTEIRDRLQRLIFTLSPASIPAELIAQMREAYERNSSGYDYAVTFPFTLNIVEKPEQRERIVREAAGELRENHLDALCLWLIRLRETSVIVDTITELQAYRSDVAYRARIDGLVAEDRIEEAFNLLQFPPDFSDKIEVLVLRARIARGLGRESEETRAWQKALLKAEQDLTSNHFLNLAYHAREAGRLRIASDAIVAACRHPRGLLPPANEISWLIGYLIENDRPDDLLVVTRRFLQSEVENPILLNNAIYLSMILGGGEAVNKKIVPIAEQLAQNHRGVLGIRTTLALAYLMNGRVEDAFGVFKPGELEGLGWQEFAPSDRAIFAMTLAENEREKLAQNVRMMIDWSGMLEAERRFFRQHLMSEESAAKRQIANQVSKEQNTGAAPPENISERSSEYSSFRLQQLEKRKEAEEKSRSENASSPRIEAMQQRTRGKAGESEEENLSPRMKKFLERENSQPSSEQSN